MRSRSFWALIALAVPFAAHATDGYFSHGYGLKSKGMAGAVTALPQDAIAAATNPAGMAFVGNRFDIGLDWFSPRRSASRSGSGPAGVDGSAESDSESFFVPDFGVNWMVRPDLALGVSVYGQGGMNTDYPGGQIPAASACGAPPPGGFNFRGSPGPFNLLCGDGRLGVDLAQLVVAPTVAWRFVPNHAIGISPLLGYQRFKVDGLQTFDNPFFSASPGSVTNRGYDSAVGWGVRIGYHGHLMPTLAVGAAYSTKIYMSEFDKYKGLFAEQGGFDMPANWNAGIAWRATPQLTATLDYRRVNYGDVKSVGNTQLGPIGTRLLGAPDGRGFGWRNVDVWKVGLQYAYSDRWTFRAGYGHSDNPIPSQEVTFNIIAPGVVQDHYTLGATWSLDKQNEISAAFMYAARNSVTGQSLFASFGAPPTTTETIELKEYSFGISYGRKF